MSRVSDERVREIGLGSSVDTLTLGRLLLDLIDSRAECERLRLECDDLAQERDGIKHSRVCRNNVAAGNSPDHPHLSDCLRCETDRLRATLAEAVDVAKYVVTMYEFNEIQDRDIYDRAARVLDGAK